MVRCHDGDLSNLKRRVDNARKKFNKNQGDSDLLNQYKELETKYRKLVKEKEANYLLQDSNGSSLSKKLYQKISSLSHSSRIPDLMHHNDKISSNPIIKANMFNKFFCDQFSEPSSYDIEIDFHRNHANDCNNLEIRESDVFSVLRDIDPSKATGPDNIDGTVLKNCRFSLCKPLTIIFNFSYKKGVLPDEWKEANVTPIHKKGDKTDIKNYRPISLTCLIMKVFENIIRNKLYESCGDKITSHQHGFVPRKSCNTQLIEFSSNLAYNLNNHLQTDTIYFDFAKAFDSVSHDLILKKLKYNFNIDGKMLNFIRAYLGGRKQRVVLNGSFSEWAVVNSGVPQGSILGPLLFVLFINDIVDCVQPGTHIKLYADDLKIWKEIRCPSDTLQVDIDNLFNWSLANKIRFHPAKCKVVRTSLKHKNLDTPYLLDGVLLCTESHEKDLGVILSSKLSYTDHIDSTISRASQKLGLIKRHCDVVDNAKLRRTLYLSLVRSLFEHCSVIWRPVTEHGIGRFEKIQKRAIKWILNETDSSYTDDEYMNKLAELELLPMARKFEYNDLTMFHKIFYEHVPLSFPSFLHKFSLADIKRPTRLQSQRDSLQIVCTEPPRVDAFVNCFYYRTHLLWNKIPYDLRLISDRDNFSKKLKKYLASNYTYTVEPGET